MEMVQTKNLHRKEDDEKNRPEAPPHTGEIFLLVFAGEAGDLPLEAHQALVAEILGEKGDVSLKKDSMGPLL